MFSSEFSAVTKKNYFRALSVGKLGLSDVFECPNDFADSWHPSFAKIMRSKWLSTTYDLVGPCPIPARFNLSHQTVTT